MIGHNAPCRQSRRGARGQLLGRRPGPRPRLSGLPAERCPAQVLDLASPSGPGTFVSRSDRSAA